MRSKNVPKIELPINNPTTNFVQFLAKEKKVRVVGLGVFTVKTRKARKHYVGFENKYVDLPARKTVFFKPDDTLLKQI